MTKLNVLIQEGEKFNQPTIDHLIEGIHRIMPIKLDIQLIGEGSIPLFAQMGLQEHKYVPKKRDEYLLLVGKTTDFDYDAICRPEIRMVWSDIKDTPTDNNLILTCHEIAHFFLPDPDYVFVSDKHIETYEALSHCMNKIDGKRCIMNIGGKKEPIFNDRYLNGVYRGFCQYCTDAMIGEKK